MLENGYIKLNRSITKWGWYKNSQTKDVFLHLLLHTNYDDCEFEGITVCRGQLVTSYPSLSEGVGLSIQNVRTAMKNLKKTGEIKTERFSKFTLVTITNYEKYQGFDDENSNSQVTVNQQSTNSQVTVNQQSTNTNGINKESNKARKINKYISKATEKFKSEDLTKAMIEFADDRRAQRKPLTEHAVDLHIRKLLKLEPTDINKQIEIINQTIEHRWQAFYPLKEDNKPKQDKQQSNNIFAEIAREEGVF